MKSVKEYFEYRDFLRDFFEEKKKENPYFSHRVMGKKVAIDASHLVKIFQKQRHIGNALIEGLIDFCNLKDRVAHYFSALVHFNKAKSDRESRVYYEKLLAQKVSPAITEGKAKKSIDLLKKLGLIKRKNNGPYCLTNKIITTGDHCRSIAVKAFQEETIRLAAEALHRHPREKRNISTVTITIAEKNIDAINDMIKEFREALLKYAEAETNPDHVYQLNIQLFPLTV